MKTLLYRVAIECSFGPPMIAYRTHPPTAPDLHLIDVIQVEVPELPSEAELRALVDRYPPRRNVA
jgi:hypothetical protein